MTLYKGTFSTQQQTRFGQIEARQLFCRPVCLPVSDLIVEEPWQAEFSCSDVEAQDDSVRQKQNVGANRCRKYRMRTDQTSVARCKETPKGNCPWSLPG